MTNKAPCTCCRKNLLGVSRTVSSSLFLHSLVLFHMQSLCVCINWDSNMWPKVRQLLTNHYQSSNHLHGFAESEIDTFNLSSIGTTLFYKRDAWKNKLQWGLSFSHKLFTRTNLFYTPKKGILVYQSNASTKAFTCCNSQMSCCYSIWNAYLEQCTPTILRI